MKLLNCTTLQIEKFVGSSVPQSYAILSHRWEAGEVTYQEVINAQGLDQKAGWAKIREACRVAHSKGHKYVWVDTCCINKQDFTELTEAINSMFKWYANAAICLAFLSDVAPGQFSIVESLWFTRGWTLQELIAPKVVEFYDKEWNEIGTRATLCSQIHQHTRIDRRILLHGPDSNRTLEELLAEVPVARRMSWASGRTTTREEDVAYSLLGIFGINMPLLYGEGQDAFLRLQTEIIKETNDMTLFAWTSGPEVSYPRGILAISPKEFGHASSLVLTRDIKYNPEYTMTNKGLRIVTEISISGRRDMKQFLKLGCRWKSGNPEESLGILLENHGGGVFLRSDSDQLFEVDDEARRETLTLYIKKHTEAWFYGFANNKQSSLEAYTFHFDPKKIEQVKVVPAGMWDRKKQSFVTKGLETFDGFVQFRIARKRSTHDFIVACGFKSEDQEWICIASSTNENREVYNAAIHGDLRKMSRLALTANREGKTGSWSSVRSVARIEIHHREGELVRPIYVKEDYDFECLVM